MITSSSHQFSGVNSLLVSGRVSDQKLLFFFHPHVFPTIHFFMFHMFEPLQARNQSSLKATKMPVGVILVGPEGLDLWTCGAKSRSKDLCPVSLNFAGN